MDEEVLAILRRKRLDPYSFVPRFLGIADTNAVLSSVGNDYSKGEAVRSRLLRMTDGETAVLYAAGHVYGEVYDKLSKFAHSRRMPVDELRARFEQHYLPVMRFVEVSMADIVDAQVLAITDPDDAPTGQLAKLIGPCIVFSEDKHLKKPGFAPADWRAVAKFAVEMAEGASKQHLTGQMVALPGLVTVELIQVVSRRIGMSPWLLTGMIAAASILLFKNPERRKAAGKYLVPVVEALGQEMAKGMVQEHGGLVGLQEVILPAPVEPSVKQQVAIILARQRQPLLAREIQWHIMRSFPSDSIPGVAEVRAALTSGSEFVRSGRYRWQFGRQAAPWDGQL